MPSPHSLTPDPAPHAGRATGEWTPTRDSAGATGDYRPADAPADPHVPGFEVLGVLGRGGMGVVYQARQAGLNRIVALKMLLGDRAGPREVNRFLVEAEAAAAVRHPHVAQVFEYGEAGGRPFLVMEYLPGGSLARLLKGGRLDPLDAAELVGQIARGVQAIHDAGIVHRDLKPANVLLAEDGVPKVTDFGLAKRGDDNELTAAGSVMGTPAYMSPEQARGQTKFVGPAADVYALGVILYRCLTGVTPFDGEDTIGLLRRVAEEEPPRPRSHVPSLPRDLELICLKCLQKAPHERYPSAAALAGDLARFGSGEPVSVRPAGALERAAKWARRKPALAATYALTAVAVALIALTAGAVWLWQRAETAKGQAEIAKGDAETAKGKAEVNEKVATVERAKAEEAKKREADAHKSTEAERKKAQALAEKLEVFEYGKGMQLAHQEWRNGNVGTTLIFLDTTPQHLRGWEWNYLHRLCHSELLTLRGHTNSVSTASPSADGTRIATASHDRTARVWDARTGAELLTLKGHTDAVSAAFFSPDGSHIVTGSYDRTAKVWDARTGAQIRTLNGHTHHVAKASFSADGARIVTASYDRTARVWDARTGTELLALKGHTNSVYAAVFSADGTRIVTASEDGTARVWDARTGAELITLKGHAGSVNAASFSADGARIATASRDRTARVWDAQTGAELLTLRGHTDFVSSVAFNRGGTRVVTGGGDQTARVWDAHTGIERLVLRGHTGNVSSVTFNADGTRVVTGGGDSTAKVWDIKTEIEVLAIKGHAGVVTATAFEPGGRAVTGSTDGTAKVWEFRTGTEVLAIKGHTDAVTAVAFGPDGAEVATGSTDGTARVWDAKTGAALLTLKGHAGNVTSVTFNPGGTRIVTGGFDHTARVWDARTGAEILTLKGHTNGVMAAAFSPDGTRIVTGGYDRTARVWDANTGAVLFTLRGHAGVVTSVAFSPDGTRLATGGDTAKVWDAKTAELLLALVGHADGTQSVSFSPDGKRIVTGGDNARVWDAKTGAEVLTLKGHRGGVNAAAFSADGTRIVTGSTDATVRVYDSRPSKPESPPGPKTEAAPSGQLLHTGPVTALGFNSDGTRLVTGDTQSVRVWDTGTRKVLFALVTPPPVRAARFGPGDRVLTACDTEGVVRLYVASTGKQYDNLRLARGSTRDAAFTADGRVVCVATDGTVTVFGPDGTVVTSFAACDPKLGASGLAVSPDGRRVCVAFGMRSDWGGTVRDLDTGKQTASWAASVVYAVAWSPDGKWIASAEGDHKVVIRDAKTGNPHATLTVNLSSPSTASHVAFNRDSTAVAVVCFDGTVEVWDVATKKVAAAFKLETTRTGPGAVAFSPDSKRLAAGAPGVVRIWDLPKPPSP